MKLAGWIIVVMLLIAFWLVIRGRLRSRIAQPSTNHAPNAEAYLGLRNLALQGPPAEGAVANTSGPTELYAVLMDWGIPSGTVTVAAYADGTASVYLSSGGGFLGGGQAHESIRSAAKRTIEIASELRSSMKPTTTFPLPQTGQVIFYVRTKSNVLTASASEQDLRSHVSPLFKLGDSAQVIITEYRRFQPRN